MCKLSKNWKIFVFVVLTFDLKVRSDLVLLNLNDGESEQICALKIEINKNDFNNKFNLVDATPYNGCNSIENSTFSSNAVFMRLNPPDCTLQTIMKNLEKNKASLAVFGLNGTIQTNLSNISISSIFMPFSYADKLNNVKSLTIAARANEVFDYSLLLGQAIAVLTVLLGTLWAGNDFKQSLQAKTCGFSATSGEVRQFEKRSSSLAQRYIGIVTVLVVVIIIIVLTYYFYDYMIYFIYIVIAMLFMISIYRIINLVINKINFCKWRIPANNLPLLKHQPAVLPLLVSFLSFGVCVAWFVYHNQSWSWILQDLIILSLVLNALSVYRVESYLQAILLMSGFLLYSIISIIISLVKNKSPQPSLDIPLDLDFDKYLTKDVNKLPLTVVVPLVSKIAQACYLYLKYPFSVISLGDMLIPGISLNYALSFDIASRNSIKIYFIANLAAFIFGLLFSSIGLILSATSQPISLYVCPIQIISTLLVALMRREIKEFWNGKSANIVCPRQQRVRNLFRIKSTENIIENDHMIISNENQGISENKIE